MMRITLFLFTNFAVMLVVGLLLTVFKIGNSSTLPGLLVICFMYGMVGSIISLFLSKFMAKRSTGTQIITQPQNQAEAWLLQTVTDLSTKAGIKTPEVGIFPSDQSNAFATGWNKNAALVAVSSGILNRMQPEELKAVLAHEIGHVANGDMVTLALIQGVMNSFVIFFARIIGDIVDRQVFKNEGGRGIGYFAINMVLQILLGFLASIIMMWFSRHREYRADEAGAKFASKSGMIAALQRLGSEHEAQHPIAESMNAFAISSGKSKMAGLFSTHPSIEQRVAALQKLQV